MLFFVKSEATVGLDDDVQAAQSGTWVHMPANLESACCEANARLGCCEKGLKCCAENKGCCAAVQKCCTEGLACCKEAKACCGPTKAAAKVAGCCSAETVEKKANCCTPKVACCADKSASGVADAKSGCRTEMQKGRNEGTNDSAASKACCGSTRKMK